MGYYLTHNTTWDRLLGSDGQYLPPAAFKGGLGWNCHRPPLICGTAEAEPIAKKPNKNKDHPGVGQPNSRTYKFRSKTSI